MKNKVVISLLEYVSTLPPFQRACSELSADSDELVQFLIKLLTAGFAKTNVSGNKKPNTRYPESRGDRSGVWRDWERCNGMGECERKNYGAEGNLGESVETRFEFSGPLRACSSWVAFTKTVVYHVDRSLTHERENETFWEESPKGTRK